MKKLALFVVLLTLTGAVAYAATATATPALDIPTYPGGESTMEINMGQADILPTIQAMLPMVSGGIGNAIKNVNFEDIGAALKDVKQIAFVQIDIPKRIAAKQVTNFYEKALPNGKWSRVFWQSDTKKGTTAVYAQENMTGLFGFRVQELSADGKPILRAQVAKIDGKIDFIKLFTIAGGTMASGAMPGSTPPVTEAK